MTNRILFCLFLTVVAYDASADKCDDPKNFHQISEAERKLDKPFTDTQGKACFGKLRDAIGFMNTYYQSWNMAARNSKTQGAPQASDLKKIQEYYDGKLTVGQIDKAHIVPAQPPVPAAAFVGLFLSKQPGSVHYPKQICWDGNKVSVELDYLVAKKDKGVFIKPLEAPEAQADVTAVDAPLRADYELNGCVIDKMVLTYNIGKFLGDSDKAGLSPLPPKPAAAAPSSVKGADVDAPAAATEGKPPHS